MKRMMNGCLLVMALTFCFGCNSDNNKTSVETAEQTNKATQKNDLSGEAEAKHKVASDFMVEAGSVGLLQTTLGKLVQEQSANSELKILGKQMEKDHEQINDQLNMLGNAKNIVVPAAPENQHQKQINDLAKMQGQEFDKKYLDIVASFHQKSIRLYENAANNNDLDAELKDFAQKTLPTLRQHLQMTQKTQNLVK